MDSFAGIAASPGYAAGPVHAVRQRPILPVRRSVSLDQVNQEIERFGQAVAEAKQGLQELIDELSKTD